VSRGCVVSQRHAEERRAHHSGAPAWRPHRRRPVFRQEPPAVGPRPCYPRPDRGRVPLMSRLFSVIVICGVLAACSGGSSPTGPTQPSLPTVPYTLTVRTQVAPPAHTSIPGILYPYVHVAMVDTPSQEWRGGYLSEGEQTMTFTNVIGLAHLVVGRVPEGSARELERSEG